MEKLQLLNETPIRTSKNFNINNIKIENFEFPETIKKFSNINIIGDLSQITQEVSLIDLKYGLNEYLTNQVKTRANQKLKVVVDNKTNKETKIEFNFDRENLELVDNIEIEANENSKATIIIKYLTCENIKAFHNGIIRVNAKQNSNIKIIVVNLMNNMSNNFLAIQNTVSKDAKLNYTIIDFGGKYSITNYHSNLDGENADNRLNTIYLGKETQCFDLNYIAELRGEKSNINIEVQGALNDNAKKHFKGTIDFKKGCKKAKGNENESCMLLSNTAKSISLPMLLCSEEEVEGNHSSSAGKIEEKELFYIMSRGFEFKEALKLMVKAKFNKILENIKNEELKTEILQEIDTKLN